MKLNEILRVGNRGSINQSAIKYDEGKIVGTYEQQEIWKIPTLEHGGYLFAIKDNNIIISHIFGKFWKSDNINYFVLLDTFTDVNYQRKGLATLLYMFLTERLNVKILSDREQTPDSESLWKSIRRQHPDRVNVYDTTTRKIIDINQISPNDLYVDGSKISKKSDRYRLILEDLPNPFNIPRKINERVLLDRIVYTDPNNNYV